MQTMFVLREIKKEDIQTNIGLGNDYTYIGKSISPHAFQMLYEQTFPYTIIEGKLDQKHMETVKAFVKDCSGENIPIYNENRYFVMTESGKTFERLN